MSDFRCFGLTMARDEADVIGETFDAALEWCNAIFVLDNGSTDGTWETVKDYAAKDARVVPFRQTFEPYRRTFRTDLYQAFRHRAEPGDWWCALDADEIYIDHPRQFLGEVPGRYNSVDSSSYQFYFTDLDLKAYEADPHEWTARRVAERMHYFRNNYGERRFVKEQKSLHWSATDWPDATPVIYPQRIRLRHLQYRSPQQIQRRLEARMASGAGFFSHEKTGDSDLFLQGADELAPQDMWRARVADSNRLQFDSGQEPLPVIDVEAQPVAPAPSALLQRADGVRRVGRRLVRATKESL